MYLPLSSRVVPVHCYVVVHSEHMVLLDLATSQRGGGQISRDQGLSGGIGVRWDEGQTGCGMGHRTSEG